VALRSSRAAAAGGTVGFTYRAALKGFSATLPAAALDAVRSAAGVKYVQADGRVQATDTQLNPPSWGLDRIDQRSLPLNQKYSYVGSAGAGVDVFIIDTGIRLTHTDFGGRATSGIDTIDGGLATDCNGHGTHVAGTAGGTAYGVAKQVALIAVRVLDCGGSGPFSGVIAGVDWVTSNHSSVGGEHEPRWWLLRAAQHRGHELDQLRCRLRGGGRQLQPQCLQLLPGVDAESDHGRCHGDQRQPGVVLQLRHLPRHLRAGQRHHVGVVHQQHRD